MKKTKELLFLIIAITSTCLSICAIITCSYMNAKLSKLEIAFAEATGKEITQSTKVTADKDKKLTYDSIMCGDVEVKFPTGGTVGKKNSKDNYFIEIESIIFRSDMNSDFNLHFDFIGTDYYSSNPRIVAKQYDAEGLCIYEDEAYLEIVKGERSKGLMSVRKSYGAKTIVIDVEP